MDAAIWGLWGTVAGAAASILTTVIASWNATRLQSSAAALERVEKARAFQRDTLVELQDAVHDEMRAVSLVYLADEKAFNSTGTWGRNMLAEDFDMKVLLATRRTLLLSERVADNALRDHIRSLRSLLTEVKMARDSGTALRAYGLASEMGTEVMQHIGTVLRALYVEGKPGDSI